MNWKIDDVAVIRNTVASYYSKYIGTTCTIIVLNPPYYDPEVAYIVRMCDGLDIGACEYHLRKRGDDHAAERYDGKDKCAWPDDCEWRPKEPVTIPAEEPA